MQEITSYSAMIWKDKERFPGKFRVSVGYTFVDNHDFFNQGCCPSLVSQDPTLNSLEKYEDVYETASDAY